MVPKRNVAFKGFIKNNRYGQDAVLCPVTPLSAWLSTLVLNEKTALEGGFLSLVRSGIIEIPPEPWQGPVLPLNYDRVKYIRYLRLKYSHNIRDPAMLLAEVSSTQGLSL